MNQLTTAEVQRVLESNPGSQPGAVMAVTEEQPTEILGSLLALAKGDPERAEKYLALYERMAALKAEREFNIAMNRCQEEMRSIAPDSKNPQTRSRYASFPALYHRMKPVYTKHGFSLSFNTGDSGPESVKVLCYVAHSDGHSRTYQVTMPADGKGAKGGDVMTKTHAAGSAMTYGQRYLLKLIFNVAVGEDDDGNGASKKTISDEQIEKICGLLKQTNSDSGKFCAYFDIKMVADMKLRDYDQAVLMLEQKLPSHKPEWAKD